MLSVWHSVCVCGVLCWNSDIFGKDITASGFYIPPWIIYIYTYISVACDCERVRQQEMLSTESKDKSEDAFLVRYSASVTLKLVLKGEKIAYALWMRVWRRRSGTKLAEQKKKGGKRERETTLLFISLFVRARRCALTLRREERKDAWHLIQGMRLMCTTMVTKRPVCLLNPSFVEWGRVSCSREKEGCVSQIRP